MGFFSKLGDAASGKTYKYNTLIGSNVNRIIGRVSNWPDPNFVKDWVYAAVYCADKTFETLLFPEKETKDEQEIFGHFKNNIHLSDKEKLFLCFKLLGGFYLFLFLKNKENNNFLVETGLSKKDFKQQILDIFEFDQNDKALYSKLTAAYEEKVSDYPLGVWEEIVEKCFATKANVDLASGMAFALLVFQVHKEIFYPSLRDLMERHL